MAKKKSKLKSRSDLHNKIKAGIGTGILAGGFAAGAAHAPVGKFTKYGLVGGAGGAGLEYAIHKATLKNKKKKYHPVRHV